MTTGPSFSHVVPHDAGLSGEAQLVSNRCSNYMCVLYRLLKVIYGCVVNAMLAYYSALTLEYGNRC